MGNAYFLCYHVTESEKTMSQNADEEFLRKLLRRVEKNLERLLRSVQRIQAVPGYEEAVGALKNAIQDDEELVQRLRGDLKPRHKNLSLEAHPPTLKRKSIAA
jgi:uncharacterized protein YaaN involved in tellurite resistance